MSSFKFLFFGWLFASQKTGFSGFRYRFIPSLRFGTGYASPYNPFHCLKLKNLKLNLIKSMFQTSRIFTEEMREVFKHDKRFIQLGMKQSCSARGVCWDTASM